MRRKRKGRGRGQDRVRDENTTSQVLFTCKGRNWREAARAAVLSYSTGDSVEMKWDCTERGEAGYKKKILERIQ